MGIDEEIEKIEGIIADIESAISETKNYAYFEYKISAWEEDLSELNDRLKHLESIQNKQYESDERYQINEYWREVV